MAVEMIEAVVHAGTVETPYLRCGDGAPLVVLTDRPPALLFEDPLVQALMAQFRLIVPRLPANGVNRGEWLRDVKEGLGLQEARVIVLDAHQEALS